MAALNGSRTQGAWCCPGGPEGSAVSWLQCQGGRPAECWAGYQALPVQRGERGEAGGADCASKFGRWTCLLLGLFFFLALLMANFLDSFHSRRRGRPLAGTAVGGPDAAHGDGAGDSQRPTVALLLGPTSTTAIAPPGIQTRPPGPARAASTSVSVPFGTPAPPQRPTARPPTPGPAEPSTARTTPPPVAPPVRRPAPHRTTRRPPEASRSFTIQWASHPEKCLGVEDAAAKNGMGLQISDCDGSSLQRWAPLEDKVRLSEHEHPRMCMDVFDHLTADGTRVQLWECFGFDTDQAFLLPESGAGKIRWKNHPDRCIDVKDHATFNGNGIQLWTCMDDNDDQNFLVARAADRGTPEPPPPPPGTTGASSITHARGRAGDVDEAAARDAPGPPHVEESPGNLDRWAGTGMCGIGTNMLDHNDAAMTTFCDAELDFWWNWAPAPRNHYTATCAAATFVPMIWGYGKDNRYIAGAMRGKYRFMMGYNEPDLWGPPAYPGGNYLSSGTFAPTFHCGSASLAKNWQDMVTAFKRRNERGVVVSPAMADPSQYASTGEYSECNASPQTPEDHIRFCIGWLKCFKKSVIELSCGDTNCWDAIDVLQFHAYEYESKHLIGKVKNWERLWADDLLGRNGRTKKTLWLTEFAHAGTTDPADPDGSARAFMEESLAYMAASPHVSGWSWFSQNNKTFSSFTIGGVAPKSPFWASDLIDTSGRLTNLGSKYADLCRKLRARPHSM